MQNQQHQEGIRVNTTKRVSKSTQKPQAQSHDAAPFDRAVGLRMINPQNIMIFSKLLQHAHLLFANGLHKKKIKNTNCNKG